MKKIIRLTEGDLHRIVKESVKRILREGAFDKYEEDLPEIELDRNRNIDKDSDVSWASAYAQLNDPMVKNIKGSTLRSMLSDRTGNNIGQ